MHFTAFLVCILAYALAAMVSNVCNIIKRKSLNKLLSQTDFSLVKMGNLFAYFSLSCSEMLLYTYFAELLKHHVRNFL